MVIPARHRGDGQVRDRARLGAPRRPGPLRGQEARDSSARSPMSPGMADPVMALRRKKARASQGDAGKRPGPTRIAGKLERVLGICPRFG
jgi:hypothetical protein